MNGQVSREEIRSMVRELLRDAVAGGPGGGESAPSPPAPADSTKPGEVGGLSERVRAALAGGPGGAAIEIAIAGERFPLRPLKAAPYDPKGERLRG